jgi:hypothetical protein
MPIVNFLKDGPNEIYSPLPKGKYVCKLVGFFFENTGNGHEVWNLCFEVTDGEYKDRYIFDNLYFNESGLAQVRCLCQALDLDISRELNLTFDLIKDRSCIVEVDQIEHEIRKAQTLNVNQVMPGGYNKLSDGSESG